MYIVVHMDLQRINLTSSQHFAGPNGNQYLWNCLQIAVCYKANDGDGDGDDDDNCDVLTKTA